MAASILAPFKPTNQPYKEGPRGLFTLSHALHQRVDILGRPERNPEKVCLVRCEVQSFEETFHSRRSRCEGHWVGQLKGWVFPLNQAQKVANLVDQVSGYLQSKGRKLPVQIQMDVALSLTGAQIASLPLEEQQAVLTQRLLSRALKAPWTVKVGGLEATFLRSHVFYGTPAIEFKFDYNPELIATVKTIPGAHWVAEEKVWIVPGRSIRLARKLVAAFVRAPRWFAQQGRQQRAAHPTLELELSTLLTQKMGEFVLDDPKNKVVWTGGPADSNGRFYGLANLLIHKAIGLMKLDSLQGPHGAAGEGMPIVWASPSIQRAVPRDTSVALAQEQEKVRAWAESRSSGIGPSAAVGSQPTQMLVHRDWHRPGIVAGLRLIRLLLAHVETASDAVRLPAKLKKNTPLPPQGTPILRGCAASAGELLFSQGRFWLLSAASPVKSQGVRCWEVSTTLAKHWLTLPPQPKVSTLEELAKLDDEQALCWLVSTLRFDATRTQDLGVIAQRCEALSQAPMAQMLSQIERQALEQELLLGRDSVSTASEANAIPFQEVLGATLLLPPVDPRKAKRI